MTTPKKRWEEEFDEQFLSKDRFFPKAQFNEQVSGRLPEAFKDFVQDTIAKERREAVEDAFKAIELEKLDDECFGPFSDTPWDAYNEAGHDLELKKKEYLDKLG